MKIIYSLYKGLYKNKFSLISSNLIRYLQSLTNLIKTLTRFRSKPSVSVMPCCFLKLFYCFHSVFPIVPINLEGISPTFEVVS